MSLLGDYQPSYKYFPAVGAFSHKFSIAPRGETVVHIKKVRGYKNGMDLLCHHAENGGDRGSRAGCRPKSVILFYLSVTLWNDKVCDNSNAIKQYAIWGL